MLAWALIFNVALAQNYPSKPLRIIIGYAPGGVADITARLIAQKLSINLGQSVLVDNRPSAGGIVAADLVAKSEPDGYTLLHLNSGNAISAASFNKLPFDVKKDFEPVSLMGEMPMVMLVDKTSEINSLQELLLKAKSSNQTFNVGTVSIGSGQHMSAMLFKSIAYLDAPVIPYKSTPALFSALKAKEINVVFEVISPALGLIKNGEIKAIAVSSAKKNLLLPNVPTVMESGFKDYEVYAWNGLAVPSKTPKFIIERLNKEINAILSQSDVKTRLLELGIDPIGGTPEDLKNLLNGEIDKWNHLINTLKIERQ